MTWLAITDYLFHNDYGYVLFVVATIPLFPHSWLQRAYNRSNPTGATNEAGTDYPSGAPELSPAFSGLGSC